MNDETERSTEIAPLDADASTVALLNKSEIDQQIATAHKYPRSVERFRTTVRTLACLTEATAEECSYALKRDGKMIVGPSARFAEILAAAWGNCRAGARVVDDRGTHIVAQGSFLDLQSNVAITYEVQRRVTDKNGRRYGDDMLVTTANAACSIALRNAILKGIPKAIWIEQWDEARRTAVGDAKTHTTRRDNAMRKFGQMGVVPERVLAVLQVASVDDITQEHLEVLQGMLNTLKEGDAKLDELFPPVAANGDAPKGDEPKSGADKLKEKLGGGPNTPKAGAVITVSEIAKMIDAAKTLDDLAVAHDLAGRWPDKKQRADLVTKVAFKKAELEKLQDGKAS